MNTIDAFILVGGKSARMGRDKASILIDGVSMVDRGIETLKIALSDTRITLVGGSNAEIADNHVGRGPWGGFESALSNSVAEWTFVMACDYPLMSPSVIKLLISRIADEIDAVVPRQADGKLQPLCAIYRTNVCLAEATIILAEDETPSLRILFDKVRTLTVPFADIEQLPDAEHSFLNVNTVNDLDKAISLLEARR